MKNPVNLLWTGGWDSTFRLLQLLIIENRPVQPIYVIDSNRKSIWYELKTIEKIVHLSRRSFPKQCYNLLDIKFIYKASNENSKIHNYFKQFQQEVHIGHQYLWMAIIAEKYGLHDLELSQEKVEEAVSAGTWIRQVIPFLKGEGHECKLDVKNITDEKLLLFKYYRFPLLGVSKLDMAQIARAHGFHDILKYAWFCHYPVFNKPCGICRPCKIAKLSGQLTVHKMNYPLITKGFNLYKKIEQRILKVKSFDAILYTPTNL